MPWGNSEIADLSSYHEISNGYTFPLSAIAGPEGYY